MLSAKRGIDPIFPDALLSARIDGHSPRAAGSWSQTSLVTRLLLFVLVIDFMSYFEPTVVSILLTISYWVSEPLELYEEAISSPFFSFPFAISFFFLSL